MYRNVKFFRNILKQIVNKIRKKNIKPRELY